MLIAQRIDSPVRLKANPNVLECRYTPLVEVATPLAISSIARGRVWSVSQATATPVSASMRR
ncbi:MAG: hypothetical protein HC866_14390 [Leptolyngbyaceae cyanobacterium RU_5_1]|nr:hypothetical protein [Leptolyngbyaceae cyanobacterium RU_5_1]